MRRNRDYTDMRAVKDMDLGKRVTIEQQVLVGTDETRKRSRMEGREPSYGKRRLNGQGVCWRKGSGDDSATTSEHYHLLGEFLS